MSGRNVSPLQIFIHQNLIYRCSGCSEKICSRWTYYFNHLTLLWYGRKCVWATAIIKALMIHVFVTSPVERLRFLNIIFYSSCYKSNFDILQATVGFSLGPLSLVKNMCTVGNVNIMVRCFCNIPFFLLTASCYKNTGYFHSSFLVLFLLQ